MAKNPTPPQKRTRERIRTNRILPSKTDRDAANAHARAATLKMMAKPALIKLVDYRSTTDLARQLAATESELADLRIRYAQLESDYNAP